MMRPILSLPLAALLVAAPALAMTEENFNRLDHDGDGAISREEFLEMRRTLFAVLDADGNGALTKAEIAAAREGQDPRMKAGPGNRIWKQDTNGDGELSLAEYTAQTRGFDFADRDDNGYLSREEFDRISRFLKRYRP